MLGIVVEVIEFGRRTQLVKAFDKATFVIQISKAQRSDNFLHSFAPAPRRHFIEQCPTHGFVVDKIEVTEAALLLPYSFVGVAIDDAGSSPHQLAISRSQKEYRFAKVKGGILRRVKTIDFGLNHRRNKSINATIQFQLKLYKSFERLPALDFLDDYH